MLNDVFRAAREQVLSEQVGTRALDLTPLRPTRAAFPRIYMHAISRSLDLERKQMQPVASIFEQALIKAGFGEGSGKERSGQYGALYAAEAGTTTPSTSAASTPIGVGGGGGGGPPEVAEESSPNQLSPVLYYGLRAALVLFSGVCATSVPDFGVVVTLLGSFSVTLGSFVLPPLFHRVVFGGRLSVAEKTTDEVLTFIGVVTCVFTTTTTALSVLKGEQ